MNTRLRLIILLFALGVFVIGFLLYLVFFRRPAPLTPPIGLPPSEEVEPGAFPEADVGDIVPEEEGDISDFFITDEVKVEPVPLGPVVVPQRVERIVEEDILSPRLTAAGDIAFYNDIDGRFYRAVDGKLEQLSSQVFFGVQSVDWSPTKNEAILEYPDGANIYYNFDTKKQVTLPRHWEDFSFSAQGDRVAAKSIGLAVENRWLVATNPDGTNVQLLEPLGENADRVTVDWSPGRQIVGYSRTGDPVGGSRQQILFIGQNGENFQSMTVEGRGLTSEWSPGGEQLLYSVYSGRSDFKPELWIANATPSTIGTGRRLLRVNTWADKCTFANEQFVYCGVPKELVQGAAFLPSASHITDDRLIKIDVRTGIQTEIDLGDGQHSITDIFIDDESKQLYFTDQLNRGLFDVQL